MNIDQSLLNNRDRFPFGFDLLPDGSVLVDDGVLYLLFRKFLQVFYELHAFGFLFFSGHNLFRVYCGAFRFASHATFVHDFD